MRLAPREEEKLMLHSAGFLAQKRLARGLQLNYTEAVALIATQVRTQVFQSLIPIASFSVCTMKSMSCLFI